MKRMNAIAVTTDLRKNLAVVLLAVIFMLSFLHSANAATVKAEISGVDLTANTLQVVSQDPNSNLKDLAVTINHETRFEGVAGIADLRAGDEINIDYSVFGKNKVKAERIQLAKVNIRADSQPESSYQPVSSNN